MEVGSKSNVVLDESNANHVGDELLSCRCLEVGGHSVIDGGHAFRVLSKDMCNGFTELEASHHIVEDGFGQ